MKNVFNLFLGIFVIIITISSCKDDEVVISELEIVTENNQSTWIWIDKDNCFDRRGNTQGYAASMNKSSKKLLIYLEGGGACFNGLTCIGNPDGSDFDSASSVESLNGDSKEIMSRGNTTNRFKDWNFVYVPYISGDVHMGNNPDVDIPNGGPQNQKMTGYTNVTAIVNDLSAYAQRNEIDEILVTGISAGGFGVYLSFVQVADAFPDVKLSALVDSGPIFLDTDLFTECFDDIINDLWKVPLPVDIDSYVNGTYGFTPQGIYEYMSNKYPNADFGLLSRYEDEVIRFFYGFPKGGCTAIPSLISGDEYKTALLDIKSNIDDLPNWSFYYTEGTDHTFLGSNSYETTVINDVALTDWVSDLTRGIHQDVLE